MLEKLLAKIDKDLDKNYDEVANSLLDGASDEELTLLADECLSGESLSDELVCLYRWHNGQEGFYSLNPEDGFTFLPIEEVIEAWLFLSDPEEDISQPWFKDWLPIFYNGAGDYLVYITQGDDKGKLLYYWHDDEDRSISYQNLEALFETIQKQTKKKPKNTVDDYEKVDVVLMSAPQAGLKSLKTLKESLSLPHGLGQLAREVKVGPVTLISGDYYCMTDYKVQSAVKELGERCLAIYKTGDRKTQLPF